MFSYITHLFGSNAPKTYSSIIKAKETYLEFINIAKKVVTDIEAILSALDLKDTVISYAEYALDFTVEKIFGNTIGKIISPKIKEAIKYIPEYVDSATKNLEEDIKTFNDYLNNAAQIELDFANEEEGSIVLVGVDANC
ncbi:MAG: hypothetical protein O7C59_00545 [Rickettsia endosymbiont of Ixodes persulcatus]|nr:hypothetical protein [Rickettsia endosymbiont of Ixodes persulcatus]MCZ6903399.1 hypothetical protein [Rickettsia endosymbiont of Ixodes persulcatus]MCZ6909266.1 hypothetical protein [Rickettsia endosymbiont of Ixodes persulcatus]MCZ6909690.1 hypothetical protein [Rickettsia endosymbiont of Ixodes persulcatus]MCZ6913152.1 hypothetical protein [Rickettsia endosymbiont of Ixodes persulcatus]